MDAKSSREHKGGPRRTFPLSWKKPIRKVRVSGHSESGGAVSIGATPASGGADEVRSEELGTLKKSKNLLAWRKKERRSRDENRREEGNELFPPTPSLAVHWTGRKKETEEVRSE